MAHLDTMGSDDHCEGETDIIKSLRYHRLTDDRSVARLHPSVVHEEDFRLHLDLLDRWGYTTITFKDYSLFRQKKIHLPRKPVIITFDNGSEETYRVALPLLRETGCKAVIFAATDPSPRGNGWGNDDAYGTPMPPECLRQLSAEGMEIGSLAVTRQPLNMLPADAARDEVRSSRVMLETLVGTPVVSFAYPFGCVNAAVKRMVEEAGYTYACAWSTGPLTFGDDLLEIRRLAVRTGLGVVGFRLRLHASSEIYEQCVRRTRSALAWMNTRQVVRS